VVDDGSLMREKVEELLTEAGYLAVVAASGGSALEASSHVEFDRMESDVQMPETSGIELLGLIARAGSSSVGRLGNAGRVGGGFRSLRCIHSFSAQCMRAN